MLFQSTDTQFVSNVKLIFCQNIAMRCIKHIKNMEIGTDYKS